MYSSGAPFFNYFTVLGYLVTPLKRRIYYHHEIFFIFFYLKRYFPYKLWNLKFYKKKMLLSIIILSIQKKNKIWKFWKGKQSRAKLAKKNKSSRSINRFWNILVKFLKTKKMLFFKINIRQIAVRCKLHKITVLYCGVNSFRTGL